MAITNIMTFTRLPGTGKGAITQADITLGFEVYRPSPLGGEFRYKCVFVDNKIARFKVQNEGWDNDYYDVIVEFDAPEFCDNKVIQLSKALEMFSDSMKYPSDEDRNIIHIAQKYGLARFISHTQANWTDLGIDRFKNLAS